MANGMTLAQLQAAVYTETNRPDLVPQTLQAVLAATMSLHGLDLFFKDVLTAQVVFDSCDYIQTLDTTTMPFYRRINFLRKDWPSRYQQFELTGSPLPPLYTFSEGRILGISQSRAFINWISPDNILDNYKAEKIDVGYQAGSTLMIKSSTPLKYGLVGWYAWPNLDVGNGGAAFSSWIAAEYPYAIVYKAASAILQKIGMTDAARKYDSQPDPRSPMDKGGLVQEQVAMIISSNIVVDEGTDPNE